MYMDVPQQRITKSGSNPVSKEQEPEAIMVTALPDLESFPSDLTVQVG